MVLARLGEWPVFLVRVKRIYFLSAQKSADMEVMGRVWKLSTKQ